MLDTRQFIVEGKVQGVFFRDETQRTARQLGVTGWVRNRTDETVEVVVTGTVEQLRKFEHWLWQGSPEAAVQKVHQQTIALQMFEKFEIQPTQKV